jgi:hypothetical protein
MLVFSFNTSQIFASYAFICILNERFILACVCRTIPIVSKIVCVLIKNCLLERAAIGMDVTHHREQLIVLTAKLTVKVWLVPTVLTPGGNIH